ncbi:MAG: hypothetical protein EOO22_05905, partial [Comamonadaceae bacterium]
MPDFQSTLKQAKATVDEARAADNARPSFKGEHLLVLGAGALLLMKASRSRSFLGRTLAGAAGTALLGRAASGR